MICLDMYIHIHLVFLQVLLHNYTFTLIFYNKNISMKKKLDKKLISKSSEPPESSSESESSESESCDSSNSDSSNSSSNTSSSEEEDFEFDVLKNDFLILYKIGSGAFSTVWLTYQLSKNEFFALKIQNHDCYDAGILEKNCLEITARFNTKCLIKLEESFEIEKDGNTYLCMVLELAIDSAYYFLKKFNKINNTAMPARVMKKLHDDVCEGLSYLHANELLHTDIKPENILVCGKDKRLVAIKEILEQIKFKEVCEDQLEKFKKKFNFKNKNAKENYRRGKKKILLQIVDELARILKVDEIFDDLRYLEYSEDELLECTFKIADLGTVHSYNQMIEENRFPCIQTRYYRAPEVIIKSPYDYHVDYWSMAIMYYELSEGDILFDPHHTDELSTDQVHLYEIVQWIGYPDKSKIKENSKFFNTNGELKYSFNSTKKEINQDNWHPEVLAFFNACMKWQ